MLQYGDMFFCLNCHKKGDKLMSSEDFVGSNDAFMQGYHAAITDMERIFKTMLPTEGMVPAKWLNDRLKGLKNSGRTHEGED